MKPNNENFILSFDFFPKIGGAHLWLYQVGKYFSQPTTAITSDYPLLFSEQKEFDLQDHGNIKEIKRFPFKVTSWGIDLNFFKNFLILLRFFKTICTENITVHTVKSLPEGITLAFLKMFFNNRLKIITYSHGEEFLVAKSSKQLKVLTKLALKSSYKIFANCNSTKRLAAQFCDKSKINVVSLGVEVDKFYIPIYKRKKWRLTWKFPKGTVVLVTVARIEPRKNHEKVMYALADLRKDGLSLGYVIIGDGPDKNRLEKLSMELGLGKWVKFLGAVSEEEKIMSLCAADIFIMPSVQIGPMIEGFGIVFMEAAAAGIPCIAGDVGDNLRPFYMNRQVL